jgi:hypothetical protein
MQLHNTISSEVLHSSFWQSIKSLQILYFRWDQFEMRAFISMLSL